MTTNYEPYFKVMKQVAAERGATYSFGRDWAAIDSTRDGERVVVEVTMHEGEDIPYYSVWVYELTSGGKPLNGYEEVDASTGATTAELMRFVEKWV